MDFHLKQWRNQHESEQQHSAKIPKLLLEPQQQPQPSSASAALPLFVPEPNSKISSMSAFPDSTSAATRFTSKISFPFLSVTETQKSLFLPSMISWKGKFSSCLFLNHLSFSSIGLMSFGSFSFWAYFYFSGRDG
jgi:hypothetical protein